MLGLRAKVLYGIVSNLAVDCILGTVFLHRYVEAVVPRTPLVGLEEGSGVPLVRKETDIMHTESGGSQQSDADCFQEITDL